MPNMTIDQLAGIIKGEFNNVDEKFAKIDERFDGIDGRFDGIDGRFDGIDGRFDGIDGRLNKIEATMVTKSYLDEKLADLRGDLVVLVRKEDTKFTALIDVLKGRHVISDGEAEKILAMEPFSRLSIK